MKIRAHLIRLMIVSLFLGQLAQAAYKVKPTELLFHRQAVKRMVLDDSQSILLSTLDPASIVGLSVMHPQTTLSGRPLSYAIQGDALAITATQAGESALWVGGFNPYALYLLDIQSVSGSGDVGIDFAQQDMSRRLIVVCRFDQGRCRELRWQVQVDGKTVDDQPLQADGFQMPALPFRLKVQMLGTGFNVLVEKDGRHQLAGRADIANHFDLRRKDLFRQFNWRVLTGLRSDTKVFLGRANAALSPGIGQADIRTINYEDGSPMIEGGRLWLTMSVRGGGLQHSLQGVFSMDPTVFDLKFEGAILFDRGDGLWRNEMASCIIFDRRDQKWRGWTTGFSAYADPARQEQKQIWAVQSERDPRRGLVIMSARSTRLIGNYEDTHTLFDAQANKWRMLLCENHGGYRAVIRESDHWNGPFETIAGPVTVDTTGTQLQMFDGVRYAIFGSNDRCIYCYSYPDLKPIGKLNLDLPPWDDQSGTRVWPNVVPLPEGYPADYLALTMDRFNFPGMTGGNWTYGAMYLFYADRPQMPDPDPGRFAKEIAAFAEQDRKDLFPKGGIVFVGSSSIRMLNIPKFFPDINALNRGFGGSHISDVNHYLEETVLQYEPKTVVFYCGSNDVWAGKSPAQVKEDFDEFCGRLFKRVPDARLIILALRPSQSRITVIEIERQMNDVLLTLARQDKRIDYIAESFDRYLDANGQPISELYLNDQLHLNDAGYRIWSEVLTPLLK